MSDISRDTGHVAHVDEVPQQPEGRNRGFMPRWRAVCETCDWQFSLVSVRSDAVTAAAAHVRAHRPPAPLWSQRRKASTH